MARDKVIGLALGILVVAVVGMLFFRPEKSPYDDLPQLDEPHKLDNRIAEKPITPYPTGVKRRALQQSRQQTGFSENLPWELSDFLTGDALKADAEERMRPLWTVPNPIPFRSEGRSNGLQVPVHNRAWEALADDQTDSLHSQKSQLAEQFQVYRVRPGDTLSGLAARFLGSGTRFHEIYAANPNVLRSPSDLWAGMQIRIPQPLDAAKSIDPLGNNVSSDRNSRLNSQHEPAVSQGKTSYKPDRRFFPIRRLPFGVQTPSTKFNNSTRPKRTLSQLPPVPLPQFDDSGDGEFQPSARNPRASQPNGTTEVSTATSRRYIVRQGDNLEKIALQVYGTRRAARKIYAANRNHLKNPNSLRTGMSIVLPR